MPDPTASIPDSIRTRDRSIIANPGGPRRRHRLPRLILCAGSLFLTAVVAEVVVRRVDGWQILSPRLQPTGFDGDVPPDLTGEVVPAFLAQPAAQHPSLQPSWSAHTPPPLQRLPLPSATAEQYAAGFHVMFLYDWNEILLRSVWQKGIGPTLAPGIRKPDRYFTFLPVDGAPLPRYRFPPSVTLPSGITLTVEVLNAACEGYLSSETAHNVRHVVLPLAVDYVVYYEGADQLQLPQLMRHVHIEAPLRLRSPQACSIRMLPQRGNGSGSTSTRRWPVGCTRC
jgi:hypothetical protein